ncbi:MAG TPA: hypothetical protein VFE31_01060 [Opitutaceae bacterium]|nr:hypothetical protein [Opitutaceae bacterium]
MCSPLGGFFKVTFLSGNRLKHGMKHLDDRIRIMLGLMLPCLAFGAPILQPDASASFAYEIPVSVVRTEFTPRYVLRITGIRGDRPRFEAGGTYLLEGDYRAGPDHGLSVAALAPSAHPSKLSPTQMEAVAAGRGHLKLMVKMDQAGPICVTFLEPAQTPGGLARTLGMVYVLDSHQAAHRNFAANTIPWGAVNGVPLSYYRSQSADFRSAPFAAPNNARPGP